MFSTSGFVSHPKTRLITLKKCFSSFSPQRPTKICLMNWSPLALTYSHIKGFMARGKKMEGREDRLFLHVMK